MVDTNQGLTKTYNALKDPASTDPRILDLRRLHENMDRAVLAAYGWSDVAVPPYCPLTGDDRAALQAFEDEVIDRLFVLNAERAAEVKRLGLGSKKRGRTASDDGDAEGESARGGPGAQEEGGGEGQEARWRAGRSVLTRRDASKSTLLFGEDGLLRRRRVLYGEGLRSTGWALARQDGPSLDSRWTLRSTGWDPRQTKWIQFVRRSPSPNNIRVR